jgi:Cdc6-like AAA superfamily ATPase
MFAFSAISSTTIIDIMITKIIIMQFHNREKELALMSLLDKSKPSFLVITGKRRVGKTASLSNSSAKTGRHSTSSLIATRA